METAFVLGGGGVLGAHEIGMLRALSQAGIRPDVVVGTSVGAINGSFVAADPAGAAARLSRLWQGDALGQAFSETLKRPGAERRTEFAAPTIWIRLQAFPRSD